MRRFLLILLFAAAFGLAAVVLIYFRVGSYSADKIFANAGQLAGEKRAGIVFGAKVWEGGVPSNSLYDRVYTAAEAYKAGKVSTLLMSGGADEPEVMRKLAVELGVAEADIRLDAEGLRSYETCGRAKRIFNIESAVLFTQDYHLPRAIYLCTNLGIESVGVDSKRRDYAGERYYWLREFFSRVGAFIDINFRSN